MPPRYEGKPTPLPCGLGHVRENWAYFGGGSCTASLTGADFSWSNTTSWQNRISSFQGYSGCRIRAFEFTSYGGSALGYTTASPNVGVLNDHIWSALFS